MLCAPNPVMAQGARSLDSSQECGLELSKWRFSEEVSRQQPHILHNTRTTSFAGKVRCVSLRPMRGYSHHSRLCIREPGIGVRTWTSFWFCSVSCMVIWLEDHLELEDLSGTSLPISVPPAIKCGKRQYRLCRVIVECEMK